MTTERDAEIRERLQRAALPTAPDALRSRVARVVAEPPAARARARDLGRQGRLLVPIAAILLIGGAAILGGGGSRRPPIPTSSPSWDDPAPHAELVTQTAVYQACGPFGCDYRVTLDGPDDKGVQEGRVELSPLGAPAPIDPALPELLAYGAYILRAEIHAISDAIEPGASGPVDLGVTATCDGQFVVYPGATLVSVTIGFWLDRCSVGVLVTADPRALPSLSVVPTVKGVCGAADGGCDYRLQLTGPAGGGTSWMATTQTVFPSSQLVINELTPWVIPGQYQLIASAHRMSKEPEPGAGHQQELGVAAGCDATFTVAEDTINVDVSVVFQDESCTIQTATQPAMTPRSTFRNTDPSSTSSFSPPYGDQPPAGRSLPITYAQLSADRRHVLVDFISNGSSGAGDCPTIVVPWVSIDGDVLQLGLVLAATPAPTACQPAEVGGSLVRYDIELPAVFLGTTYRDLSNGDLYAFP